MMENKALILVAHGSRKESSNQEVMALGEALKRLKEKEFALVVTCFLEFAQPSLQKSILTCIEKGMEEIIVLPYFLASGNHVTRDIPQIIDTIRTAHPEVRIILKAHLGSAVGMVTLLGDMAE
jgi:sirohydrochlorin ferrochelatase